MTSITEALSALPADQRHASLAGLTFVSGLGILPMTTDIVFVGAGVLLQKQLLDPVATLLICTVACALSEALMFEVGARFGTRLLKTRLLRRVMPAERLEALQARLAGSHRSLVYFIRFTPTMRPWLVLALASLGLERATFYRLGWLLLLAYVPLLIGLVALASRFIAIEPEWVFYALIAGWCVNFIVKRVRQRGQPPPAGS